MIKNRKLLDKTGKVYSTNRGFRIKNHCVATQEQTKKGLSFFNPKRIVETDGIHATLSHVWTLNVRDFFFKFILSSLFN